MEMARVLARAGAADQPGVLERAQQAAQVPRVEVEVARSSAAVVPAALRELPEQARLGQREARRRQLLVQDADPPGVEAVEAADRFGARGEGRIHALIFSRDGCWKQSISCLEQVIGLLPDPLGGSTDLR